ncbi:hypothetical protein C8R45DRAFT_1211571 [Mycena sanguinolenta]|nr:hypothetical protein C8R45DRAFT_1211571 [Mycena sanguinolenta]
MSSPRQAPSPLRDRFLSNSPRAWNENSNTGRESPDVSPLRIAKRDSPLRRPPQSEIARRNSSSFKHVRNNNLVTKSPFKSQIPTAATPTTRQFPSPTRRVSGEKRPRPQSIHDQAEAENDRPFAYKRERRQSKTFQGLLQKEVVTKSPFRQQEGHVSDEPPPIPPVPPTPSRIPVPSTAGPSPGRSSLVSKRMHGPRLSGRRERRKTVTFDERCDVVEFDRDEDPSDESADDYGGDGDEDNTPDGSDPFFAPQQQESAQSDSSYESIDLSEADGSLLPDTPMPLALELDADTSISGLVDAMFAPVSATSTPPPQQPQQFGSSHTRTFELPPLHNSQDIDHATDLDTEDGVPFGRSHHAARAAAFHEHAVHPPPVPQPHLTSGGSSSRPLPRPDLRAVDTTPPRPHAGDNIDHSTPPLGRTTHFERRLAAHEEEYDDVVDADVSHLPGSPSPAPARHSQSDLVEIGLPRFSLPSGGGANADDPFALPKLRDEPLPDVGEDSRDVSISARAEADGFESQGSQQSLNSSGGRPRISREEVAKRMRARSASPELEQQPMDDAVEEDQGAYEGASEGQSRDEMQDEDEFREEREEEARFEKRERLERERVEERSATASINTTASITTEMEMEVGTVEVAERVIVPAPVLAIHSPHSPTYDRHDNNKSNTEIGLRAPDLGLDFGSRFGLGGLGIPGLGGSVGSRISATSGLSTGTAERRELERVAVDMEMRSALDQLIDDVGGGQMDVGNDSVRTEEAENSLRSDEAAQAQEHTRVPVRAATDSALLQMGLGAGLSRQVSVASSSSLLSLPPPPVPPKDNIRSREQIIIEKRREMRRYEEEGYDYVPPPAQDNGLLRAGNGRPSARRSMSTGDVEELTRMRGKGLLDIGAGGDLLGQSIEQELNRLEEPHKRKYQIREHERMIYASSSDNISHMNGAGDVNTGKAWKTVRRPSDMNEYSKQIKEYRAQQNPGKAYGKVFVKVLGVRGMHLPLPAQPTAITCTLNNGIHFVTTPECALARDCRIEQEFELIEHSKLEFTLTLKVRRDPHIISQFKAVTPTAVPVPKAVAPPPVVQQTSSKGGLRSFWSSSPKKSKEKTVAPPPPPPQAPTPVPPQIRLPENLARYLKPDGTLARVFVSFKDIAARCDTRLFETSYPLIGQRAELGGKASTLQVGELVLQMFQLPPLPGIPPDELPQSLEECHRGLRHINWHKVTYFQGTLTQNGGDCSTWRRRQLRVIGANLVAFNDVTKKATATIDLKKAVAVEDNQESRGTMSPASGMTGRSSRYDEYDTLYGVERSFRLVFPNDQEIMFFADTDEEKSKWLEVLRALVGHIPPHPLWAELLWQRQDELSKQSRLKST